MAKDFDMWNSRKKRIDAKESGKFYHEGEVWWCSLGVNVGSEQNGSDVHYRRPVLVLKGYSPRICLVVPLTTACKEDRFHFPLGNVAGKESSAIISQLKTVDSKRFVNRIFRVQKQVLVSIKKAVRDML